MGLFSRKKSDDGHRAEKPSPTRNIERSQELLSDWPTEPMQTEQEELLAAVPEAESEAGVVAEEPDQPVEAEAEAAAEVEAEPVGPETYEEPSELESDLRAAEEPGAPGPEAGADEDGSDAEERSKSDTGTIEKEELRRAMNPKTKPTTQPTEEGEDEHRLSAEQAMAPTPQRRHPFAPEPADEVAATRHMKVYALANQKGGVAKTTTTLNLAVALSESGHRVLCVDMDPQGNLTMSQGIDPDEVEKGMYNVLVERMPIREIIQHAEIDIAVASIDLAGAEIAMSTQIGRERALQKALAAVADDYDFVCIDTPPSLGLLTINALTAADKVIVPVQCEYLSMRGLIQLQNTLEMIRENLNPNVEIEGILPTMLDSRTVHAKEAVEILEENFGDMVFKSRIKKTIKFAEAPVKGSSVLKYDPEGSAAGYYRALAEEVLTHGPAS